MIASLALSLALLAAEPDPCADASPTCRQAAAEAILTWRTEALVTGRHLAACTERLSVRTPTVAAALLPVVQPGPAPAPSPWPLAAVGLAGLAVGLVVGLVVR